MTSKKFISVFVLKSVKKVRDKKNFLVFEKNCSLFIFNILS